MKYDVVNVGAAGTFVVRKPGARAAFLAELRRRLPFETHVMACDAREFALLTRDDPFSAERLRPDDVRFVGVLAAGAQRLPKMPVAFPPAGAWLVRVIGCRGRFVLGVYRRHMKTIGYLGRIDALLGVAVTIRNWNTVAAIARTLEEPHRPAGGRRRERSVG